MSDLAAAALGLAEKGVAVFPVGPDKAPRTARGHHDATTDAETIRSWSWNGGGMIGAAIAPGTVVVDEDPRNGGTETLALLARDGKTIPATRTVKTGGGGFHYYLKVPEGVSLRSSLGPGVDVKRAGKGYVVVPPSSGYVFLQGGAMAEAPAWLLEELVVVEREGTAGESSEAKFFTAFEAGTTYGLKAMEGELGRLATAAEGGRNDALNRSAFALAQLVAGGELDEGRAKDELLLVAERIGLEPDEARKTIESGWRAGEMEPRQAPALSAIDAVQDASEKDEPVAVSDEPRPELDEARFWVDWSVDEPAPPFYLHPLLPKHAYVLVYGSTEAAKSMTWVGLLCEGSHRGVRSSVYSLENPPHTDRDRLRRWGPDPAAFRLTNEPLDFNDPCQLGALVEREKAWGTDVLMLDTYSHAFNSKSDDGNAKAIEFARRIRWVMAEVGCSVIVVDHTGFEGDEPRDASAKRQQVDVAILMKKEGDWRPGQPARFSMHNRKAARFANPFRVQGEIRDTTRDERKALAFGRWVGSHEPRWGDEPET